MSKPTALVTGGTSGIGKATTELLHQRGYQVIITGQNPDTIAAAQRDLPPDILVLRADARSLTDTDKVIEAIRDRFGTLDVLFLNAGISRPQPVDSVDEATFDDLVNVNFKGQFFTLQKALPLILDGGSIVFTIGIGVTRGVPGGTITAATRGALLSLMPSLALELAPRRIRVNAVSPGAIETPMWDKLEVPAQARKAMGATIPFGRFGSTSEIAEVVAFLASDAASYITGQNIVVAGGSGLRS
ncbi:MAG: SDR family oxidoreductase [Actinomycetota bacterium]|nr:SDR family oxidoreductase [Actinomycetota bacterium]